MTNLLVVAATALLAFFAGGAGLALVGALLGMFLAGAAGPLFAPRRFGPEGVSGAITMVVLMDIAALLGFLLGDRAPPGYSLFIGPVALALLGLTILAIVRHVQRRTGRSWK